MTKKYWTFNKDTLVVNHDAKPVEISAGQEYYPRTALTNVPLDPKDGYQVCVILNANGCAIDTEYVEDHRDETVYLKTDCNHSKNIEKLGPIDSDYTPKVPKTRFDKWNVELDDWQTDTQLQYEALYVAVINKRRALYSNVDALRAEAAMIRLRENNEEKTADYEAQAIALYEKIREENPFPEPPIN